LARPSNATASSIADTPIPSASFVARIGAADAFLIVTPEYNHGYPGPAEDRDRLAGPEWQAKPVGFVSYGGLSAGLHAVEQLRAVFAELHTVTIRETVSFHGAHCHSKADYSRGILIAPLCRGRL
jgi:NAD(P)H-dependent FMN reductase